MSQTEALAIWLEEVSNALIPVMPYHKLRFVVHEAFVNACKHAESESANIIVVIRHNESLEIAVTDPGLGFELPTTLSGADRNSIGYSWNLVSDRHTNVVARIEDMHTLGFSLKEETAGQDYEIQENHRGLISILKAAKNLTYHYVPNSFNYLHITC